MRPRTISVIGGSSASAELLRQAQEVGAHVARRGATLVTGGLGGIMEAASKGAQEAGGTTVGILPGTDPHEANAHVSIPIQTSMGDGRNLLVALSGEAVIAIGGRLGTLSEIALALKNGRPVIGLGTWTLDQKYFGEKKVQVAKSAEEAVRLAFEAIGT